jgi:hypothetical protein
VAPPSSRSAGPGTSVRDMVIELARFTIHEGAEDKLGVR